MTPVISYAPVFAGHRLLAATSLAMLAVSLGMDADIVHSAPSRSTSANTSALIEGLLRHYLPAAIGGLLLLWFLWRGAFELLMALIGIAAAGAVAYLTAGSAGLATFIGLTTILYVVATVAEVVLQAFRGLLLIRLILLAVALALLAQSVSAPL